MMLMTMIPDPLSFAVMLLGVFMDEVFSLLIFILFFTLSQSDLFAD